MARFQSIERMMTVLEAVASVGEAGARPADVVDTSGLNRATAHRFLKALQSADMLDHDPETGRYFIGLKIAALAQSASRRFALADRASGELNRLVEATGDTVYLTIRDGDEAVCATRLEGAFPIRTLTLKLGDRRPLGVGAGSLALLAFLPDAERARLFRAATQAYPRFGLDPSAVQEMAVRSLELGYAFNDGRVIPGMSAVAVPLRNASGRPVAAISVAAIEQRMQEPRRAEVIAGLVEARTAIEGRYGAILNGMKIDAATEKSR